MSNYTSLVKGKVIKAISDYSMVEHTDNVIVGFSGGADSLCLLHVLFDLKRELNLHISAAHINHGIRGEEAKRDADFAREFCEAMRIPFYIAEFDCPKLAEVTGESLEECGRRLRYEFFNSLCNENSKIATAHNLNDNAETVIFNIIRGSALKGACGIPAVRDNIIRPLIYCSREEIEGYCKENTLDYVTDSTNLSDDYTRNKIRHNIIPAMESINIAAVSNIGSFSSFVADADKFISAEAEALLYSAEIGLNTYSVQTLSDASSVVVKQAIVFALKKFTDKSVDSKKIETIYSLLDKSGRIQIFGDVYAETVKKQLRFFVNRKVANIEEFDVTGYPFECDFNDFSVKISEYINSSKKINKFLLDNLADCDKISGRVYLRTRHSGDNFTFASRRITKSLKKLFSELNIPIEQRDSLPVLCDDIGVVWVYGVGVNSRCRIDSDSSNIIFIRGEDNDRQKYD